MLETLSAFSFDSLRLHIHWEHLMSTSHFDSSDSESQEVGSTSVGPLVCANGQKPSPSAEPSIEDLDRRVIAEYAMSCISTLRHVSVVGRDCFDVFEIRRGGMEELGGC